jgi:hypothetical protein
MKRELQSPTSEGGGKRSKNAEAHVPSRVLHVRSLPQFTNEAELISVCQHFGAVQRVLVLNAKQQAFVQMESVDAAQALLTRYSVAPPYIRGKPVYFQYSNRNEVKTPALGGGGGGSAADPESSSSPTNILIVSILEARVPVTIDNIQQIFKPYGEVLKIITFVKNDVLKALVQLGSVESAINAKLYLEGKDMFQGCCHLRIGFSKLKDLTVKQNGPRMRDFTTSDWSGDGGLPQQQTPYLFPSPGPQFGGGVPVPGPYGQYGAPSQGPSVPGSGAEKGGVVIVSNLASDKWNCEKLFMLFGVYGDVIRVKILYNKRDTALVQFASPQQAHLATLHVNRLPLYGKELNVSMSKHQDIQMPRGDQSPETASLTKDYSGSPVHRFKHRTTRLKNISPPSQVLHVSNLYDGCTEEELRKLFGQEQRGPPAVQFFKNDRKMAFVKMDSVQDATYALMRLHNSRLGDKYMRISFSSKDPSRINDGGVADGE